MSKIHFVSLGCPKNLVDSEVMLGVLQQNEHQIVAQPDDADVIVVNTCGFIQSAKEESIDTIQQMAEFKRGSCKRLVVAGCLAQRYRQELAEALPQVDGFVGTGEILSIASAVAAESVPVQAETELMSVLYDPLTMPRMPLTPSHLAYVKIAEGCNRVCSFCAIPSFRGKQRSRSIASIVQEVKQLRQRGVQEINLIAQDTPSYGSDRRDGTNLVGLLRGLLDETDAPWIRLFYLYPQGVTDELIELMGTEPRIVSYLDVPFQHFAEPVLKRMKRPWRRQKVVDLVRRFRQALPDATLRTTVLLGFPGESDEDFETVLEMVKLLAFDRLGVFTYSDEDGTSAYQMTPAVDPELMEQRKHRLMVTQGRISLANNLKLVGRRMRVLVDGPSQRFAGFSEARGEGHAPEIDGAVLIRKVGLQPGQFMDVEITGAEPYDLFGAPITGRRSLPLV